MQRAAELLRCCVFPASSQSFAKDAALCEVERCVSRNTICALRNKSVVLVCQPRAASSPPPVSLLYPHTVQAVDNQV